MKSIITELSQMHHTDVAILCVFIIAGVITLSAVIRCGADYLKSRKTKRRFSKSRRFTIWKP